MNEILNAFYKRIESEYKGDYASVPSDYSDLDNLSDIDRKHVHYEYIALYNFKADIFKKQIEDSKQQIIDYFAHRIKETKDLHLQARYNYFLSYITKNNSYASKAVEYYQKILSSYLSNNNNFPITTFTDILDHIISLSVKCRNRINKDILKKQINNYLKNSALSLKVKTIILEKIDKNEYKLFNSADLLSYPQLCIDLATNETEIRIKERLLKTAAHLAQKVSDNKLAKVANEMLGDLEYMNICPQDEHNIAVSHLNEYCYNNIIKYYRKAGQKEKMRKAIKEFEENKEHHKYITIHTSMPVENGEQVCNEVNKYIECLLDLSPEEMIRKLCFDNLLFPTDKQINARTEKYQSTINECFFPKLKDVNNNTISISSEKIVEYL